jgi:hypothetical protein
MFFLPSRICPLATLVIERPGLYLHLFRHGWQPNNVIAFLLPILPVCFAFCRVGDRRGARAAASQRLQNSVSFASSARDKSCRVKQLWAVQRSNPAIVCKGKHLQTIANSPFVAAQHQRIETWDSAGITSSPTYDLLFGQPVESSAFVEPLQTRDFEHRN